jgi:hypothetical protein
MIGRYDRPSNTLHIAYLGDFKIDVHTSSLIIAMVPESIALGGRVIVCTTCWRVSTNPHDVQNRYCASCRKFLSGTTNLSQLDLDDVGAAIAGDATNFTTMLLRLIAKSDPHNRERIRLAYPEAVDAWEQWQRNSMKGRQT